MVILTDGGDNENTITEILSELEERKNIHLYFIGMGSEEGGDVPGVTDQGQPVLSKLNTELLKSLAGAKNYFSSDDVTTIQLAQVISEKIQTEETSYMPAISGDTPMTIYDRYYQFPLGIAILMLIGLIYFPDTLKNKER